MAFREVRDPETGELVIKYDAEGDRIQYVDRRRRLKEQSLAPYRAAKEYDVDARSRSRLG